jgi:hypothetical protein
MFETVADQADGLRRLFTPREPAVISVGCCAGADACRRQAGVILAKLARRGHVPRLFDRLDLDHDLGEVQAHAPVDRLLLLDHPVRLARWLDGRAPTGGATMLLMLTHRPEALPGQYAAVKSIAARKGVRRVVTCFVDAPSVDSRREAHARLATCVGRFLDVEIAPLASDADEDGLGEAALVRLARLELGIRGLARSDLLMEAPFALSRKAH